MDKVDFFDEESKEYIELYVLEPVSYTHLDVYKRQPQYQDKYIL